MILQIYHYIEYGFGYTIQLVFLLHKSKEKSVNNKKSFSKVYCANAYSQQEVFCSYTIVDLFKMLDF